jgi:hypothetical protein
MAFQEAISDISSKNAILKSIYILLKDWRFLRLKRKQMQHAIPFTKP